MNFIQANERSFDALTGYQREQTETFAHAKAATSEHQPDRLAAREQAIKAQIERDAAQRDRPQQEPTRDRSQQPEPTQSNSLSR